jgi:transcriptional regulator with XRE-family HTH domain
MKTIAIKNIDELQKELIKKGLNIRDFSKMIEISYPLAHMILTGKRNPSPRTAKQIIEYLKVEFDDVFEIV